MNPFLLDWTSGYSDVSCPNCNQDYDLDWTTEYGDPYPGQYEIECPKCDHKFLLDVSNLTRYTVLGD